METTPVQPIQTPGRRHAPRYAVSVPVNVTVLRSGVPVALPGRSVDVGEGGLCAVLAGDLHAGESVGVEFRLPHLSLSVLAKARVCYQQPLRCGLQFLGLTGDQRGTIRYWAERTGIRRTLAEVAPEEQSDPALQEVAPEVDARRLRLVPASATGHVPGPATRTGRWDAYAPWVMAVLCVCLLAGMLWWRWEQGWQELEAKLPERRDTLRPPVKVPAEVMQRLLVHKVDPVTPENPGQEPMTGVVVLDAVIGSDGTVVGLRPVSGQEPLARAAMDAVRWWRFEPYRVSGQPVDVETTLAVEFE